MAVAPYLVDTSALARLGRPPVAERLDPLQRAGLVATCSLIDMELLFGSRSPAGYRDLQRTLHALERLDTEQRDWDRAEELQAALAARSMTRAVGIPDLLIAAVAERHRVTLLHYDSDFDLVAEVSDQRVEWVVERGSVP